MFNYLLESSRIHFISSAVPVLDIGELPAMTSPLGSTTQRTGTADSWTCLGLSLKKKKKKRKLVINNQNRGQKVSCWGCSGKTGFRAWLH